MRALRVVLGTAEARRARCAGDADGLVAIPQDQAEGILASAKAILAKEEKSMKEIKAGTVDRGWVDKALKEKGYQV